MLMESTHTALLAALLPFLLFHCQVTAEKQTGVRTCPSGQYRLHPHGPSGCVPCQNCGDRAVIKPASPTHDTVCADPPNSTVVHLPCLSSLSLSVEFKRLPDPWTVTEVHIAKTRTRTCGVLKKYQTSIFPTWRSQSPDWMHRGQCAIGTYQWSKADNSGNVPGSVDCRPCSQCPSGKRVMFPCQGQQDNLCSFDRVNNTAELFHMQCSTKEIIQVYSSERPTVSQSTLANIETELIRPLCAALHNRDRKIWRRSVGLAAEKKVKPALRAVVSRKAVATSTGDDPSSQSSRRKKKVKKARRKRGRKHRRRKHRKSRHRSKAKKNIRRLRLKDKTKVKEKRKGRRFGKNRRAHKHGRNNNSILDSELCRKKKYKGKRCKQLKEKHGHHNQRLVDALRERRKDSISSTMAVPTADRSPLFLNSGGGEVDPRITYYSATSPRAPTTLVTRFQLDGTRNVYRSQAIDPPPEVDLEEGEDEQSGVNRGHTIIIISAACPGASIMLILSIMATVVCKRRMIKANRPVSDLAMGSNGTVNTSLSPITENSLSVRRIVDPLRWGREYSRDSGYSSVLAEGTSGTVDMNILADMVTRQRGSQADISPLPYVGKDVRATDCPSAECEYEANLIASHLNSQSPNSTGRSPLFDDLALFPTELGASSPKLRSPSGDSSVSSASSSVSIQLRIPLKNIETEWLHKASDVRPENVLTTYSTSIMTQTEDWSKTNLKTRPIFSACWQGCKTFTAAGGTWSLPRSDLRLEVPPEAVPSGSSVDITAATYTNLAHLRQELELPGDVVMVGPLAEIDAGPGFRFQRNVHVFPAHCLPPGVPEDQIKISHIDKGEDGQLIVRLLPSKREYDLKQAAAAESREALDNGDTTAEDDIGYFQFLSSGELKIVTKRFCGFLCSICSKLLPEPRMQLVVTARQQVKATASGERRQIRVCLHLWDRKITTTDFKRDYLGNSQVGEQTLHVIDDYEDSLMKIFFTINEEEAQQQWKHAVRPGTTESIFLPEKSFRLRELLCCHAKDAPRCEEWLAESVLGLEDLCYDFQCIIDVANVARPDHPDWAQGEASRQQLTQKVTIFIGDITTTTTTNNNNTDDTSYKGVPPSAESGGIPTQKTSQVCQCHQQPGQPHAGAVSNTPFGQLEQGPSERLDLSDFPGWVPLSREPRLDPVPWRIRNSDPTPLSQRMTTEQAADDETQQMAYGRSVSCPQTLADHARFPHEAAEAATMMEGRNKTQEERRQYQQLGMSRGEEGDGVQYGNLGKARDRLSNDGEETINQPAHDHGQQNVAAVAPPPEGNGGAKPKILSTGIPHHMPQHLREQGRQCPDLTQGSTSIGIHPNLKLETRSKCSSSIPVHDQKYPRTAADSLQSCADSGFLPDARRPGHGFSTTNPGLHYASSGLDDPPKRALNNRSETVLADSPHNINLFFHK